MLLAPQAKAVAANTAHVYLYPMLHHCVVCALKVAQLAGYVSEHSAYHHGEQSLTSTIVGLAQDFVGSNNINMLVPSGQFGTRLQVCIARADTWACEDLLVLLWGGACEALLVLLWGRKVIICPFCFHTRL